MANPRRVIRRVHHEYRRTFDEQLWPTFLALVLFGGFLCGVIDVYLEFDDPRWYANAWTAVVALPLAIGSLILLLALVDARRGLRRPVQFAIVLSLICNVGLILAMDRDVFSRMMFRVAQPSLQPRREIIVPEYYRRPNERRPDWLQRLEQSTAAEPEPEQELSERTPNDVELAAQPQPVPVPKPRPTTDPNVVARRQLNRAQPRRADRPTPLSRRVQPAEPQLSRPQQVPAQPQITPAVPPRASDSQLTRRDNPMPQRPRREADSQNDPTLARAAPRRRAAASDAPRDPAPSARVARRDPAPRQPAPRAVPRAESRQTVKPARAREPQAAKLVPSRQVTERAQPTAAAAPERSAAEEPSATKSAPRQSPQPARAQIAALPQPREDRRPRLTSRPSATTTEERVTIPETVPVRAAPQNLQPAATRAAGATERPEAAPRRQSAERTTAESARVAGRSPARRRVAPPEAGPQAAAAARELARRASATSGPNVPTRVAPVRTNEGPRTATRPEPIPSLADTSRQTSPDGETRVPDASLRAPEATRSPTAQRDRVIERRAVVAADPTLTPLRPANQPARATSAAAVERSPVALSRPSRSSAREPTNTSQTELDASALAAGRLGTAGVGGGPNLDRGQRAGANPALLAAGSRVRKQPTEDDPSPQALHSARPAEIPRSRGGQRAPQTALKAQPVETAPRGGSDRPGAKTVASASALTRSRAQRERGPSANDGQVEVDLGPTRLVASNQEFRPAGGGQPRVGPANPVPLAPQLSRRRPDRASLDSNNHAVRVTAAAGEGGGNPVAPQPNSQALARAHRDPGGERATTVAPRPLKGPSDASQSSASSVVAALSRSRPDQSSAAGDGPSPPGAVESQDARASALRIQRQSTSAAPATESTVATPRSSPTAAPSAAGSAELAAAENGPRVARRVADGAAEEPRRTEPTGDGRRAVGGPLTRRGERGGATTGPAAPGGGSGSPRRSAVGRQLDNAEVVAVTGRESAGTVAETGGLAPQSQPVSSRRAAAAATQPELAAASEGASLASSEPSRRRKATSEQPALAGDTGSAAAPSGGPSKRVTAPRLAASSEVATAPAAAPATVGGSAEGEGAVVGGLAIRRRRTENLTVDLELPSGIGGLGRTVGQEAGLPDRRAVAEREQVQARTVRFARRQLGGLPDYSAAVATAVEPFRRRQERREAMSGPGSSSRGSRTEATIERGLAFLARYQARDGRWGLAGFGESVSMSSDTAATGLALLCFTGGAYSHRDGKYAETVDRGLTFLVRQQQDNGDLYRKTDQYSNTAAWLYSHSIATIALCEAYGMTQDPALRVPAQRAIDFIVAAQHPERGGWRYVPGKGTDTSVTGWMLMALYSARLAGLDVLEDAWPRLDRWLNLAQAGPREPHLYRYNPFAPNTPTQGHGREPTKTMTAVGLLLRFYASGWRRDNEHLLRGADYLLEHPPANGTLARPQRDTYYWYYATQVMFHVGGDRWQRWWEPLSMMLRNEQIPEGPLAGSWDPRAPVPDRWGPHAGRHYVTTLNLLSLEVRWRHLPIYDDYVQQRQDGGAEAPDDADSN